jgi:hypothetical protein
MPVTYEMTWDQALSPPQPSLLLEAASGGRYLQRSTGQPFPLDGISLWSLCQSTQTEREELLDIVEGYGFKSVLCMSALSENSREQYGPPQADGLSPFTGAKLIPNETYWSTVVDHTLEAAAERDIVVQLAFLYFGHASANDGWRDRVAGCSEAECTAFGEWLGARYAATENLIWVMGGDNSSLWDSKWQAIVDGILAEDPNHLMTGHPARNEEAKVFGSTITLNTSYRPIATIVSGTLSAYADDTSARPVEMFEGQYEGDGTKVGNPNLGARQARAQSWQARLSNACGANYGNHAQWTQGYISDWPGETTPQLDWPNWKTTEGFTSAGTQSMAHYHAFFNSIQWWTLVGNADTTSTFVTAGRSSNENYVAAAFTSVLGVAYIPAGGEITVDMSEFSGPLLARWFDPTSGAYTVIGGTDTTPYSNSGSRNFDPGTNAAGDTDMVLILEVA